MKQLEIHRDDTRFKVVVFGRRGGKSVLLLNDAQRVCLGRPGARAWIVCPTYGQAKDIYWRDANMINRYVLKEMYVRKNDSDLLIEYKNGSILQFKGADRPETLRGSGLDFLGGDEVSEWRYARETINTVLMPTLSDKMGKAIFVGTPKGENYFKEMYEYGLGTNSFWKSWKVPTWESGAPWVLTPEGEGELERLRNTLNEDYFMQEYGADFRKYTGLVFKEFERSIHVKEFDVEEGYSIEAGMDFGWTNPTTCLFSYFDRENNWYIFDEHYDTEKTAKEHAGRIVAMREKYPNHLKCVLGDSAAAQTIRDFGDYGWYVTPISKDSIQQGIDRISERLKINVVTGKPKIFIHPRCMHLIEELERYRWKEQKADGMNEKDVPEDADNHCIDAARYIINHHTQVKANKPKLKPLKYVYRPRGGI